VIFNITWSKDKQCTVKGTVICFGINLSYQWRKGRVLLSSGECQQLDNGRHHKARQTVKQIQYFKLEVLTNTPYSPDFTPSDFYVFCAPKYSTWTSLRIGWGSKAGGAWLTGIVNKRLLFPRNLYLSGTLVEVLSSWWELHCRLVSPYCICFFSKSHFIYKFSGLRLKDTCTCTIHSHNGRVATPHFLDFKLMSPGGSYAQIQALEWLREVLTCIGLSWLGFTIHYKAR
jgi:hypothetical protein